MTIAELVESLRHATPWQMRAVVVASVQRMSPVLERLGDRESLQLFQDYLELLWNRVGGGLDGERAVVLDRRLESVQKALDDADDSDQPGYYPMIATSLLVDAATAFKNTSHKNAADVLKGAVDIWDALETHAYGGLSEIVILSPADPRKPGNLERFECDESQTVLEAVRDALEPDPDVLELVQQRATTPTGPLEETLSSLVKRMGW